MPLTPARNYLRARGEYGWVTIESEPLMELPPRTRRILDASEATIDNPGTTSAHAENTMSLVNPIELFRNYLRARGEYIPSRENTG